MNAQKSHSRIGENAQSADIHESRSGPDRRIERSMLISALRCQDADAVWTRVGPPLSAPKSGELDGGSLSQFRVKGPLIGAQGNSL